jgi:hypothetical protein
MPIYTDAAYGGETVVLANDRIRVEVHKRTTGWGWAEIYTPAGKPIAIIPHFGEVEISNAGTVLHFDDIPRRLEAADYIRQATPQGDSLSFNVHSLSSAELLKGSLLETMTLTTTAPALQGRVTLTLDPVQPVLHLDYHYINTGLTELMSLHGPWLLVGTDSFGTIKHDGIFPGIEWLQGAEWSSGCEWFMNRWALRVSPHPFKVGIPLMALSHDGLGIGLAWDPLQRVAALPPLMYERYPQPVYASPDFCNRANQHLMGLMLPSSAQDGEENEVYPRAAKPVVLGTQFHFSAEVFLAEGNSLDVVTDWVQRHGLPQPPAPRQPLETVLERIAQAYNSNLWTDGEGWGMKMTTAMAHERAIAHEPQFLARYISEHADTDLSRDLTAKLELIKAMPGYGREARDPLYLDLHDRAWQLAHGRELLAAQRADGAFPYEPQGRHGDLASYAHQTAMTAIRKPIGQAGDTALDLSMVPALELLRLAELTGEKTLVTGACAALDYCLPLERPDGGDWWETPLHSPNLLAAGHAAIAYELGYRATGDKRYRAKAIYWNRALLPFTHLWEPEGVHDLYCTKPCLCASDWMLSNWVTNHVEWEVIQALVIAEELGIDWAEIDPAIDWHRYAEGIAAATTYWILDASRADELPWGPDLRSGALNGVLADAHDSVTGKNWGLQLMPGYVGALFQNVLARRSGKDLPG